MTMKIIKITVLLLSLLIFLSVGFVIGAKTDHIAVQNDFALLNNKDESTLLALVSQYRVNRDLPPLKLSNTLCEFASVRADQIQTDWSHNGFFTLSSQEPYKTSFYFLGEVLARNLSTNQEILQGWESSPPHKAELDRPDYHHACVKMKGDFTVMNFGD